MVAEQSKIHATKFCPDSVFGLVVFLCLSGRLGWDAACHSAAFSSRAFSSLLERTCSQEQSSGTAYSFRKQNVHGRSSFYRPLVVRMHKWHTLVPGPDAPRKTLIACCLAGDSRTGHQ